MIEHDDGGFARAMRGTRRLAIGLGVASVACVGCATAPDGTSRPTTDVAIATTPVALGALATQEDEWPPYGALGTPQAFDGMGPHRRRVTTDSTEAQRFFDQGLNWLYAFNHDEAVLSFTRAAELDPGCAMAWWGIAQAQGPNYNDPMMTPARSQAAWAALERARTELDDETALERALIEVLGTRYEADPPEDRSALESAFANAMAALHARYPDDADIGALAAEAAMVRHPWMLYASSGEPAREETLVIVAMLERVLAADPAHPGANHLYIHAVEPSNDKARALGAAEQLSDLVPTSGHMLHMPSHIYVQTGHWERAIEQSAKAMSADDRYRVLAPDQIIQHGYMAHNSHMMAFAAMMVGREREAMDAARQMWSEFPEEGMRAAAPFIDVSMCAVYDVHKRFGRWEELLSETPPPDFLPITCAIHHAHRAVALAALKRFDEAEAEQRAFREAMRGMSIEQAYGTYGDVMKLLLVSEYFVAAEIALQRGDLESAVPLLEQAVAIEDLIGYGEPPVWLQPTRHTLGVVHLNAGRYADAERVYRADLAKWPGNGWSLLGLSQALEAQGDRAGAAEARRAFESVWGEADETLTSSCKCLPGA